MPTKNDFVAAIFWSLIGLVVTAVVFVGGVKFDATVSLSDLAELAVTVGLLFYLQNLLAKKSAVERIEKDLILEKLRMVVQKLLYFREFCERERITPSLPEVRQSISSEIRAVEAALLETNAMLEATPLAVDKAKFGTLTRGIMKIRPALIGGRFPKEPLDLKTYRLVCLQIDARVRDLHRFIVYINRLD